MTWALADVTRRLWRFARTRRRALHRRGEAGFTLIEALISTALMAAVLAALATVTAQWLPNWNRGFVGVQRSELLAFGLERLVGDLSAAEFVPPNRDATSPVFEGDPLSVTFVRSAIGPNSRPGLDLIRLMEVAGEGGLTLVRTGAPFVPLTEGSRPNFSDPVVVVRPPFRIAFSYAGVDRVWKDSWREAPQLPKAVRLQVRDASTSRVLSVSTAMLLHANLPSDCISVQTIADCDNRDRKNDPAAAAAANATAGAGNLPGGRP
jgi:general secretion pathway protein J